MDRKILITLIVILLLLSPILVCKKKEVEETEEEEVSEVEEEEEVEEPEKIEGFVELNQTKEIGDYVIVLKGFEITDKVPGLTAKSGNEFVKVDLEASNKKGTPWLISSALAFRIKGEGIDEIKTSKYQGKDAFVDGMFGAEEKTGGSIIFEIPENTRELKLIVDFSTQNMGKDTFDLTPIKEEPSA